MASARNQIRHSKPQSARRVQRGVDSRLLPAWLCDTKTAMKQLGRALLWLVWFAPMLGWAQVDPIKRDLIQLGFNQPFEGHAPFAGYAFYYHNQPNFLRTNLTLRLAVAPIYVDSEFGFVQGLGPNTDFGLGLAGCGFADSYNEIHGGTYFPSLSFDGHGAEISASVYHLFNPGDLIPLNLILRGTAHYSTFDRAANTDPAFQLPGERGEFSVRTGLRWGGIEPTLFPALAMELSLWYEGQLRTGYGPYGINGGYQTEEQSHLFWTEAALSYTLPESQQNFYVRLIAGSSVDADRFSAYRLGGYLPLVSEFPMSLPGYYFQEISARQFLLFNANYLLPLDKSQRWNLSANAATAIVDYLPGTGQPGNSLTGVGGGILYRAPSDRLKIMFDYAYGVDAVRSHGRCANNIGILLQWDLEKTHGEGFTPAHPDRWRGWQWIFPD